MERGEEEWTTAHKVTDCLVAESPLCPSFSWHFSRRTFAEWCQEGFRIVGTQSPSVPPRHILLSTVLLPDCPLSFLNLTLIREPWEERRSEGGREARVHPQNISVFVNSKCQIGLVVILERDGEARAGCGGGHFLFPQWNGARGVPPVHVLGCESWGFIGS